jgi:hypothetical protein
MYEVQVLTYCIVEGENIASLGGGGVWLQTTERDKMATVKQ